MITLDSHVKIPEYVSFTLIAEGAILLNTQTNKYFALDDVGSRLWELLGSAQTLRDCHALLLGEYQVEPAQLEQDMLELLETLRKNELVELPEA